MDKQFPINPNIEPTYEPPTFEIEEDVKGSSDCRVGSGRALPTPIYYEVLGK